MNKIIELLERIRAASHTHSVSLDVKLAQVVARLEAIEGQRLIQESPTASPLLKEIAGLRKSIEELGATTAVVRELTAGLGPAVEEVGVGVGQLLQRQGAHPTSLLLFTFHIFLVVASYSHCLLMNPVMTHVEGNVYHYPGCALGQCSTIDQSRTPSDGCIFSLFPLPVHGIYLNLK